MLPAMTGSSLAAELSASAGAGGIGVPRRGHDSADQAKCCLKKAMVRSQASRAASAA